MGEGNGQGVASPSHSILGSVGDEDSGSQPDRRSEADRDSQSSVASHPPSRAPSLNSHASLGFYGQSVRINDWEGSAYSGPSPPAPGQPGFGVLVRPTPGGITEIDKAKDEA